MTRRAFLTPGFLTISSCATLFGTGQLPKFADDLFALEGEVLGRGDGEIRIVPPEHLPQPRDGRRRAPGLSWRSSAAPGRDSRARPCSYEQRTAGRFRPGPRPPERAPS